MTSITTLKRLAILCVLAAMMSMSAHTFSAGDAPELSLLKMTEPGSELGFYTFTVFPEKTQAFSLTNQRAAF